MNMLELFGRKNTGTALDALHAAYSAPQHVDLRGPAQLDNMPQIDAVLQFVPGTFQLPTHVSGRKAMPGQKRGPLPKPPKNGGGSCG